LLAKDKGCASALCNQKDDSKKSLMLCISPAAACSTGTIRVQL
ncbi:unnamed protein product, partial [Onchocerca ochengi]